MAAIPKDLDEAIAQAQAATKAAIADGLRRLQVEIVIPELKVQPIAEKFIPALTEDYGEHLKVYFPDAGAAALARRDWGETPFVVRGMSEMKGQIQPDDEAFLFVEPSSVEVNELEKMCLEAGDRPVVLLLPRMENIAVIGIGVAGRNLRERFLNSLESCYYIRPLDGATLFRCYPSPWQVWLEVGETFELVSETATKPMGDALEQILAKATGSPDSPEQPPQPKRQDFLSTLKSFMRALTQ
ncbi:DUF1995 family protein [Microcoleus sp. FACHB-672]|uniref:DUF1995 family protein n=1 Tax=Microcoleus sp. FACHB-672 TaxID=2692825 RepID=UPI001686F580|nr:DUF1995 family protein [Microcoleus sp. FACHB-672]MBD2043974.1 DUF1995 family protein [Microcoleus sp. FACHB-672]